MRETAVDYLRQAGLKGAARSALADARVWFEQALGVLETLPESRSTLEQGFEVRLELRPALSLLGEVRAMLERLREAEALAERLNDDHRRGRVSALMAVTYAQLGELDEALVSGMRARETAVRLGDLRLRILTTTYLELTHYFRGEYNRVTELASENFAALPADWVYEFFGLAAPPSVNDRAWLVMSLAQLGRFTEAAEHEAELIRLAEPTQHAYTVGLAYFAAGMLNLLKGDWAKTRSLIEHAVAVLRTGNVVLLLPWAVSFSAWVLAQFGEASEVLDRLREGEHLLERQAVRGLIGYQGWDYHSLGRACLRLGQLDEARRFAERAVESSSHQPGFAAHALHLLGDISTHPDRFDAESGEAYYRQALGLAEPHGMRPLVGHCYFGLGKLCRRTGHRDRALDHLTIATTTYREMDMGHWLSQAEMVMTELT
jgi:tetratricopeptide (TPR) repeat protein